MKEIKETFLSSSINGQGIIITSTEYPGMLVHETLNNSEYSDKIYLSASSSHSENVDISVRWGEGIFKVTISANSPLTMFFPGFILKGGATIGIFASVPNVISVIGNVTRTREVL